jgi:hypothetical protein
MGFNSGLKGSIKPVAIQAAESLTLNKGNAKRPNSFERKFLRKMFGGIKLNENWRKRLLQH